MEWLSRPSTFYARSEIGTSTDRVISRNRANSMHRRGASLPPRSERVVMNTAKWSRDLQSRSGFRFHVRPVGPGDEAALGEFFTHVTPDDLRFRFLSSVNVVSHGQLSAMIDVDHREKENFLALDSDGTTIIATAMVACDPALTVGEVAISIRPDFKGRGVSWKLLEHVARFAEELGVATLQSIESNDNHSAIELEREMGYTS